ncbi:2TM domain-containing protein [Lyngbya aestuarii]|uniref:2TM domain-containing protein n=1 Tax=Lyngbya aestuarii TaxID=118322 RepID=UPI00403DAB7A
MSVFETQITRSYKQEEIQQILNLAIAHQVEGGDFSHEQLVEIAAELCISTESLQLAQQEWLVQQKDQQKRDQFNSYRHRKLQRNFGKYLIVNIFLVCLNLLTSGQLSWSLYILLFWGLGLGLSAWSTYQSEGEEYQRSFQKWQRQQQLKQVANSLYTRVNNWLNTAA